MDCQKARRTLSESLDGTRLSAALTAHLSSCAACSRVLAGYSSLNAALGTLPQLRPSAAFASAVLAAIPRRRRAELPAAPLAAALTVSSLAVAVAAARLSLSVPRAASAVAKACAWLELASRLAYAAVPAPAAGARFALAFALGASLFLVLSLPETRVLKGAKS